MLDSIKIQNFKAIQDEEDGNGNTVKKPLELKNLAQINYLVGENGGGKSSVLEAVHLCWFLSNFKDNIAGLDRGVEILNYLRGNFMYTLTPKIIEMKSRNNQFAKLEFTTERSLLSSIWYKTWFENNQHVVNSFHELFDFDNLEFNYITDNLLWVDDKLVEFLSDGTITHEVESGEQRNIHKASIKKHVVTRLFRYYGVLFRVLGAGREKVAGGTYNYFHEFYTGRADLAKYRKQVYLDLGISDLSSTYEPNHLSSGEVSVSELIDYCLLQKNKTIKNKKLILIDEPELHLQPLLQKNLARILEYLAKNLNIQFLITTHSPFIISAAGKFKDTQKVYMIENGQTVDVFGIKGEGENGYLGSDCINVVNEMLGSSINDYFGNLTFLAEKSVCAFLAGLKENPHFTVRPFTFILSDNGQDEAKAREVIKLRNDAFLYLGMTENIKVIIDDEINKSKKFQQFIDLGENKNKIINLKRDEVEPLYGEFLINKYFNSELNLSDFHFVDNPNTKHPFKTYLNTSSAKNDKEVKVKLGKYAGKNITETDFKTNFESLSKLILPN